MSDQPKPTTGEWTPAFVMEVREGCEIAGVDFDTKIANGHNEQLAEHEKAILALTENCKYWRTKLAAAVREAILNDVGAEGSEYIVKLEKQLAAEREKTRMAQVRRIEAVGDLKSVEKQLDAERKKRDLAESLFRQRDKEMTENLALAVEIEKERNELNKQLAAHAEQLDTLRELREHDRKQLTVEREKVAVLQGQVDNADVNLEQVKLIHKQQLATALDAIRKHNDWILNNDDVQIRCYLITLSDHP